MTPRDSFHGEFFVLESVIFTSECDRRGWPSLLQAGCVAQETSSRASKQQSRGTVSDVGLKFLESLAPRLEACRTTQVYRLQKSFPTASGLKTRSGSCRVLCWPYGHTRARMENQVCREKGQWYDDGPVRNCPTYESLGITRIGTFAKIESATSPSPCNIESLESVRCWVERGVSIIRPFSAAESQLKSVVRYVSRPCDTFHAEGKPNN